MDETGRIKPVADVALFAGGSSLLSMGFGGGMTRVFIPCAPR